MPRPSRPRRSPPTCCGPARWPSWSGSAPASGSRPAAHPGYRSATPSCREPRPYGRRTGRWRASTTGSACAASPWTRRWSRPPPPRAPTCGPGPGSRAPAGRGRRRAHVHRGPARRGRGAAHLEPQRAGLLLRLRHRPPPGLAVGRGPVAAGRRARHRVSLRRRPHARPAHAAAGPGAGVPGRSGGRLRPHGRRHPRAGPPPDDPGSLDQAVPAWEQRRRARSSRPT
jgi:hypothetical protein